MSEATAVAGIDSGPQPASVRAVQGRIAELKGLLGVAGTGTARAGVMGGRAGSVGTDAFAASLTQALGGDGTALTGANLRAPVDLGAAAVSKAKEYFGVDYLWGGEDPATGVDCSGLVQYVYGSLGIDLPRVAADQSRAGVRVDSLAQARPGDLVFFGSPAHHVGIYAGNGKMIDAPRAGKTVGLHDLWGTPSAIRRVVPEVASSAGGLAASTAASVAGAGTLSGPYASLFTSAGRRHGVDPALLSAVAKAESSYNPRAVSPAGAQGLMQLMPGTARGLGVDAFDTSEAVDGAARLLSDLMSDFGGRVDLALAGYNAGPGAVRKYGGIPPYTETQNYVRRVMKNWKELS